LFVASLTSLNEYAIVWDFVVEAKAAQKHFTISDSHPWALHAGKIDTKVL
jgi:hypothetical protein